MRLDHILPSIMSLRRGGGWLPLVLMGSATLLLLLVLLSVLMASVVRSFSIEWRSTMVERYVIVLPLSPEESIYAESLRQKLVNLLADDASVQDYNILTEEEIRAGMSDALEELPETYDYTLPIIAYVHLDEKVAPQLLIKLRSIHSQISLEDRGAWTETLRGITEFFFWGSGWIAGSIMALGILGIVLHLFILVFAQYEAIMRMANLGAARNRIRLILAHYCLRWMVITVLLMSGIGFGLVMIITMATHPVLPVSFSTPALAWITIGIPVACLGFGFFAWCLGWWFSGYGLKRYLGI